MKISIIIPIYNNENTLKRCLLSFLKQDYNNVELICIDDASTDNSFKVCQSVSSIDTRVRPYRFLRNQGVSSVRNFGIDRATGDIIGFADADDTTTDNSLLRVNEAFKKNEDCQAVSYGFYDITGKVQNKSIRITKKNGKVTAERLAYLSLSDRNVQGDVWNKFFKKNFIGNVRFYTDLTIAEDLNFVIRILMKNPEVKVLISSDIIYNYYHNSESVTRSNYNNWFDSAGNIEYVKSLDYIFIDKNIKMTRRIISLINYEKYLCALSFVRTIDMSGNRRSKAKKVMKENYKSYLRMYYVDGISNFTNTLKHVLSFIEPLRMLYHKIKG